MIQKLTIRLLIALAIGIPIAFLGTASVQAGDGVTGTTAGECQDCHAIVQEHWAEGAHANAITSEGFQTQWNAAGQPTECFACHTTGYDPETGSYDVASVSCSTCHNPIPANHPDQIMPTDISAASCGDCHLETYSQFTESVHAGEDLACVNCHSPHTNSIRATDTQALCASCHAEEVHFFQYTAHYEEGLLCVDCHLRVETGALGEGHGQREHTFEVDLATCSRCHGDEMHSPMPGVDTSSAGGVTGGDMLSSSIQSSPAPASPLGFALVATLIGTALGMILAPWSERLFNRADN